MPPRWRRGCHCRIGGAAARTARRRGRRRRKSLRMSKSEASRWQAESAATTASAATTTQMSWNDPRCEGSTSTTPRSDDGRARHLDRAVERGHLRHARRRRRRRLRDCPAALGFQRDPRHVSDSALVHELGTEQIAHSARHILSSLPTFERTRRRRTSTCQHVVLLAATVLLVVRNAALVDAPSAGWTHGSPWIWTHFQRYEPEPEPDPIGFLWPPAQLELSVPSAAEAPSTAVKLTLASEHYRPMRDGARVLQVDENPPMALESSRPERLTLELQGLAAGMHTARAWLQSGPPAAATRIDFEVPAADGDPPPLPPPEPPPPEPEPSPPRGDAGAVRVGSSARTGARRCTARGAAARGPRRARRRRPAVVCPRRRAPRGGRRAPTAAPPDDRARPDGDARGAAAVGHIADAHLPAHRSREQHERRRRRQGRPRGLVRGELRAARRRAQSAHAVPPPRAALAAHAAAAQRPGGRAARPRRRPALPTVQ